MDSQGLTTKQLMGYAALSSASYIAISTSSYFIFMLPFFYIGLFKISSAKNSRVSFYLGLLVGLTISAYHLRFFANIFQSASIALWLILAFWISLFCIVANLLQKRVSERSIVWCTPCLFFLIDVFMCEMYQLKFTWLNTGFFTYKNANNLLINITGIYGFSLLIFLLSLYALHSKKKKIYLPTLSLCLGVLNILPSQISIPTEGPIVSGVQLEFPDDKDVLEGLEKTKEKHPQTDIFLLSEYTFLYEVPREVKEWCKSNKTYLVCGSKIFTDSTQKEFYNSATVVNPQGEIEFTQTKSVPIQFFSDGIAATKQELWYSPWGKFGLAICYDLSYAGVIDNLVKQGAEALLIPTMDVISWGAEQHYLHSKVAPVKAVEYNIPIFKVSSSGISQFVNSDGHILAKGTYPGQGDILSSRLPVSQSARRPVDRFLFWPILILLTLTIIRSRKTKKPTEVVGLEKS
ncbi:MAG: carbon-nitrogen hydrolase family protein [Lentisphaeraceae bacterium]|nr:carbon-nitrogen hydrolase family protein [Lentisphaeraceae bacterium]